MRVIYAAELTPDSARSVTVALIEHATYAHRRNMQKRAT